MTTIPVNTLLDEQLAELPEHMAVPDDRILMVFKGATLDEAVRHARESFIENPDAWKCRAYLRGVWSLAYEVRA